MQVALDELQAETLREVLQSSLKTLRTESARADSHEFREMLHRRERIIEELLNQLEPVSETLS